MGNQQEQDAINDFNNWLQSSYKNSNNENNQQIIKDYNDNNNKSSEKQIDISIIIQNIKNSDFLQKAIIKDYNLNKNFISLSLKGGNSTNLTTHVISIDLSTSYTNTTSNIDGGNEAINSTEVFLGTLIHESQHNQSLVGRNWLTSDGLIGEFFNEATSSLWQGILAYQEEKNSSNSQFSVVQYNKNAGVIIGNQELASDIKTFLDGNIQDKDAEATLLAKIATDYQYAIASVGGQTYWQYYLQSGINNSENQYSSVIKQASSFNIVYDKNKQQFDIYFFKNVNQTDSLNANSPLIIDRDDILRTKTAKFSKSYDGQVDMPSPLVSNIEKLKKIIKNVSLVKDPIIITNNINNAISPIDGRFSYQYDFNQSGVKQSTSWLDNNSFFLVTLDGKGQPVLVGNSSTSGFNMLKQYDTNGDGIINSNDAGYSKLYLWDSSNIGNVQPDNLYSLSSFGITSISLTQTAQNINENGSTITSSSAVTFNDGSQWSAIEANLQTDSTYTTTNIDQDISNGTISTTVTVNGQSIDLTTLPNLHGYGTLSSLLGTMASGDTNLITDVQNFNNLTMSTSWNTVYSDVKNILLEWGNYQTSNFTLPDGTKGPTQFTSGNQELNFLDNYMGSVIHFDATNSDTSYYPYHQKILDSSFNLIENDAIAKLALQGPYKELQTYFTYDESNDTIVMKDTDANTLQALMNQYLSAYTPNYYNNTGTDSATAFWRVVSTLFQASENSIGEDLTTEFNNLKTVNTDMAQYIVNSQQNISINGYYPQMTADMTSGQTITWNPDNNIQLTTNAGTILATIDGVVGSPTFYYYVNHYIYTQAQDGNYNLPENEELQQNTLVINANYSDTTFSLGAGSYNDYNQIWITTNGHTFYIDKEINITNYVFNDQSISESVNSNVTGYDYIGQKNNEIFLGVNSRVTYDTKGYITTIYNISDFNNIIFNQGYQNLTLNNGDANIIINAGTGFTLKNTTITQNNNNFIINFNADNTGNIDANMYGQGMLEIDYQNGDKNFIVNNKNILNEANGENENIIQNGFATMSFIQNISVNNFSYSVDNDILSITYINPSNNTINIQDNFNQNSLEINLNNNQTLYFTNNQNSINNPFDIWETGLFIDSSENGGYFSIYSNYNDYTNYDTQIFNTGYKSYYINLTVSNYHINLKQDINTSDINLQNVSGNIILSFTDKNDIQNNTGTINIIGDKYINNFITLNNQTYSIVYGINDTPIIMNDFVTTEDNQIITPQNITENIVLNNDDTINYNVSNNTLYAEMDNANSFTLKMDTSLNQINIEKIDDMRVNIETNSNQNGNVIVSFDQYSSVGMVKTIQIQATDLNEQIVYDNQYYPDYNSNGEQTYLILSSSIQTSNNIEFNSGYKNLTIDNLNNYLNINLNQNPSYDDIQYSLTNTNQVTFNFTDQNDISADTGKIIANTQNNGDIHLNNIGTLKQTLEILNSSTQAFSTYSNNEIIDTLGRSRNITINNENTTIEFGKNYATENITDNQTNPLNIQFYQNITSSDFIISKTSDGTIEIHLTDPNDTSTGNIMITDKNNGVVNLNFNNNTIAINPLTYNFSTQNNLISTENLKLSTIPNVSQKNITINTIEQTKETYAGNSQNISHTTQSTLIPILNNQ